MTAPRVQPPHRGATMKFRFLPFVAFLLSLAATTGARAVAVLDIGGISATPSSVQPGQAVQFTVTINNSALAPTGGGTANDFTGGVVDIGVDLSSLTAAPIVLGVQAVAVPAITAAGTTNVNVSFVVPLSYSQAASYYINATMRFRPGTAGTGTAVIKGSVSAVNIVNTNGVFSFGSGYSSAPTVSFAGGLGAGGTAATATAIIAGGAVIGIDVTSAGSGYTSAPTVTIAAPGGSGTTALATAVVNGVVASVSTAGGAGYSTSPLIYFTGGGGGTNASANASLGNGVLSSISVAAAGSGYTVAPAVTITGGGGSGAAAVANITSTVGSLTLTAGGNNLYSPAAVIAITGGGGSGATATAIVAGKVTSLSVTTGGTGYGSAPTVTISGGGGAGATATAIVAGGVITGFNITNAGSGYTSTPSVVLSGGGGGSGGAATANVQGAITGFTITSPGSGYTSVPVVTITDATGAGATATAVLSGIITSFTITAPGSNYTSAPTVSLSGGGGGSGGAGSASISASLASVTMVNSGSGYTVAPSVTLAGGGPSQSGNGILGISSFSTASASFVVTGTPDLAITSVAYGASVAYKGGDVIPMSLTYTNPVGSAGKTNVPFVPVSGGVTYFRIQVVLSSNPTYGDADDFQLSVFDVATVTNADGLPHTLSWNQFVPGNFAGSYYVLAKIDSLNAVAETIENDLTQNGNNIWSDVAGTRIAILPTTFPTMYMASAATSGVSGNGYSDNPSITADGRYTVFASDASNLVSGSAVGGADTNNVRDIFIYDNQTGTTRRLNLSQQGAQANAASNNPSIAPGGRYVAFSSDATNLVLGDSNGFSDIFVVDVITGAITLDSVATNPSAGVLGVQGNGSSFKPSLSSDGRYLVFESSATNLVSPATAVGVTNIYLRDRTLGTTTLVSRASGAAGAPGDGSSIQAVISADGKYVAFASLATNLVAGDTNGLRDVFLRDLVGNTTIRVSVGPGGVQSVASPVGGDSRSPSINQDGRYIAFMSEAQNLVANDTNGTADVFVYDRVAATTTRVSVSSSGGQGTDPAGNPFLLGSINPGISATGRYVTFASMASNLTPGDALGRYGTLAAATVAGGGVTAVTVTNLGTASPSLAYTDYASIPTVTLSGGGGSGAAATAVLSGGSTGRITGFTVTNAGTGYTSAPTVTVNGEFNASLNIYVADRDVSNSGTYDTAGNIATSLVSVNKFGYQTVRVLNSQSTAASDIYPVISADGRWVAMPSDAEGAVGLATTTTNLLSNDANGARDVFLNDRRINSLPNGNSPPTVTITAPGNGSTALVNTAISVTASATAATVNGTVLGVVSSVQFFVNGTSLGTSTVFPYSSTWTPTAVGTYTLSALVTDSFGNLGVSPNVTVTINAAPSVGLTAPVGGTSITVNTAVSVTATAGASNPGGKITGVQFFANGTSLGTSTAAPFGVSWTPTVAGNYTLTATASELANGITTQTTSPAVAVTVITAGGGGGGGTSTPPTVSLLPVPPTTASVNQRITLSASAAAGAATKTITGVQFFANGTLVGIATAAPYTAIWVPQALGTYAITAVATDNLGASTTSVAATVSVTGVIAVTLNSPAAGATIPVNTPQTVAATASASIGTITQVQFFANNVSIGTVSTFPFVVTWTPLTPGFYNLSATATDNTGATTNSTINTVTVATGTAPAVAIVSPTAGSTVSVGLPQTIVASASAGSGTIASVQFLANGLSLGTVTTFPYNQVWTPAGVGPVALTAVATDSLGNRMTSSVVNVTVAPVSPGAPVVSITSPAAGSTLQVGLATSVTAVASDPDGTISKVDFLVNGVVQASDTTFPYSFNFTPTATGTYRITAVATDNGGNATTSSAVTVTVSGGTAPTVAIASPADGATVSVGLPQTIVASASAASGTIASVQFLANGVSVGTATTFPYNQVWTPAGVGTVALTAVATDSLGNIRTSAVVNVTVAPVSPGAPVVSITSPAGGSSLSIGTITTVTAAATDPDGTIAKVDFFANGVSLGSDNTYPYSVPFTPTATGTYNLTAVATDNGGNTTTSSTITVTVSGGTAPAVAIVSPSSGAAMTVNVAQNIFATATSATGIISSVQFFVNGVSLATKTTFPYSTPWTPGALGSYSLQARATDNSGNVTDSAPVVVTVSAASTTLPVVALTSLPVGTSVTVNQSIFIGAVAASPTGLVTNVEFYANNQLIGSKATAPYFTLWNPTTVGNYTIKAIVTDDSGNRVTSATATVATTARSGNLPVVNLSFSNPALDTPTGTTTTTPSPFVPVKVDYGSKLIISASAVKDDGTITNVQFFANGVSIGSLTAAPYFAVAQLNALSDVVLTALVTDSSGNTVFTNPILISTQPASFAAGSVVTLVSPTDGASYVNGAQIVFSATHNFGTVTPPKIDFYVNGAQFTTVSSATAGGTYQFIIGLTRAGSYVVHAVGRSGNTTTVSSPVRITVTNSRAPAINITSPAAGTPYTLGTGLTIAANASSTTGLIQNVQFFVNGAALSTKTTAPYTASWNPGSAGSYTITALATDDSGNQTLSSPLALTLVANTPPAVTMSGPPTGSSVIAGTIVNLTATATDVDGTVASVRFLANGNSVGTTATAAPFTTAWTPSAAGTYNVIAQATDNSGNVTNSDPITIRVTGNQAPVVAITTPSNGAVVRAGAGTTLTATASDPDGTIASVQFFANGTAVGSAIATLPYRAQWTPTAEGIYRITSVAIDNAGASTTSTVYTVLVVSTASGSSDNVYTGDYSGAGELGRFAAITVRGKTAAFIGYSTTATAKTYFYSGLPVDGNGAFLATDGAGRTQLSLNSNDTGLSGTLGGGSIIAIGINSGLFPATRAIASGYYAGNLTGRPASTVAAIIGADGTITIFAGDGAFQTAGAGAVDATGAFTITTSSGNRFTGKADPATGFLTGTLSGANGGTFSGATASGISFSDGFLRNLSTRGQVGTGANILIAGFVVGGTTAKQVLVRAVGPTLASFGISGALANPQLQIFNSSNALVVGNDNWGGAGDVAGASGVVGAFPLPVNSLDSAVVATLSPGAYTAQVSGVNGTTGVALVELYDVDNLTPFSPQKVMNVATRGVVSPGQGQLIAGFVVSGNTSKKLLIRAVGPTLAAAPFNVAGVLADPFLRIVRSDNVVIRENDNWEVGNDASLLSDAAVRVGAFPLAAGGKDAALLINLPPGTYSAQASGPGTSTGVALIEVYEVP